jgi:hypothetical protein
MVFIYLFSDTLARRDEEIDSSNWSQEVQEKCGICNGSYFVVEGPIEKSDEFNKHIKGWVCQTNDFMDKGLKGKMKENVLPGRSMSIVHKCNMNEFKSVFGRNATISIEEDGEFVLEKDLITGIYHIDLCMATCNF